jgi:predicted amidophosphoribosyltransferase
MAVPDIGNFFWHDSRSMSSHLYKLHDSFQDVFSLELHEGDFRSKVLALKLKGQLNSLWKEIWMRRVTLKNFLGDFDLMVPVPNSLSRIHHYGFSPAHAIAECLQKIKPIPINLSGIKCRRGMAQTKNVLSYGEKILVLKKWMKVRSELTIFEGKRILIVDDVYNSGATYHVVSEGLKKVNPQSVKGFMIAYTGHHGNHFTPSHIGDQWSYWLSYLASDPKKISLLSRVGIGSASRKISLCAGSS